MKTKVMVRGLSKSRDHPCGVCSMRVKANSALCLQCGKWIHCIYIRVKKVTAKCSRNITYRKCEGNIGGSGAGRKVVMKWKQ